MLRRASRLAPALVLALFAWTGLAATAQAQSEWADQVRYQLDLVKTFAESVGWEQTHDYRIESLRDDESDEFTGDFREGWEYRIVAFCDEDCRDIDLYLEDENGNEIDSDVSTNDVPVIECDPAWSGEFQIRVRMYECEVEPCYFGIGVFGRRK
jgi:hypothetical protein